VQIKWVNPQNVPAKISPGARYVRIPSAYANERASEMLFGNTGALFALLSDWITLSSGCVCNVCAADFTHGKTPSTSKYMKCRWIRSPGLPLKR
jgi:hypothetical protein